MKYELIKPMNPNYGALEQVLTNRGIPYKDIEHYLHTTDDDINEPELLGEDNLRRAAATLIKHINNMDTIFVVVDCDCDGFTSAALLCNYLYDLFPNFVKNNLVYKFHEGKQHGLEDMVPDICESKAQLVICPDAASNDFEQHEILTNGKIDIIVLDHHLADKESKKAIVINNQLSNYPNKELSGVGIVWQFCRYLDKIMNIHNSEQYVDLVALGNTGDMMSLTSIETKHLIEKGFRPENIHNPYINGMWERNKFKLGEHINSIDAAFYIVPMINAIQRSGTLEEKELLFKSMLKYEAFKIIPSTKRGHLPDETETLVTQAVRMSTNVKIDKLERKTMH